MARGEIKKLSSLFEKYKDKLIPPEATVINTFIEVIFDLYGFKLDKSNVRYNTTTKTLSLSANGLIRTEIKLKETEVLTHLMGRLGKNNAPTRIV